MGKVRLSSSAKSPYDNPEIFAGALAHVVKHEGGDEQVLGQCWLADHGKLVTCGHVVEQFISHPNSLSIKFPSSGNRYEVKSIHLHPSFVRQADQLVKFDAAVIEADLVAPEATAKPLPIVFERTLKSNEGIWTVRFPIHIGGLSAAPQPLAQTGTMLGFLRKFDTFHLLHDLALSPGDSGAALFDGSSVIGIHCGDTASVPGLNLPTTSIRLFLWVDALRELGIQETPASERQQAATKSMAASAVVLLASFLVAFAICAVGFFFLGDGDLAISLKPLKQPPLSLNIDKNALGSNGHLSITANANSFYRLFIFAFDGNSGSVVYPKSLTGQSSDPVSTTSLSEADLINLRSIRPNLYILGMHPETKFDLNLIATVDPHGTGMVVGKDNLMAVVRDIQKVRPGSVIAYSINLNDFPALAKPVGAPAATP
jgi:hypothetical protein